MDHTWPNAADAAETGWLHGVSNGAVSLACGQPHPDRPAPKAVSTGGWAGPRSTRCRAAPRSTCARHEALAALVQARRGEARRDGEERHADGSADPRGGPTPRGAAAGADTVLNGRGVVLGVHVLGRGRARDGAALALRRRSNSRAPRALARSAVRRLLGQVALPIRGAPRAAEHPRAVRVVHLAAAGADVVCDDGQLHVLRREGDDGIRRLKEPGPLLHTCGLCRGRRRRRRLVLLRHCCVALRAAFAAIALRELWEQRLRKGPEGLPCLFGIALFPGVLVRKWADAATSHRCP
mmetsp:Transcript_6916/g.19632  ORF Transcript_6916/g.19632 Transcript_6916/m.19632 type:complete len:295 (-) Transcript_6916:1205-2089(-)